MHHLVLLQLTKLMKNIFNKSLIIKALKKCSRQVFLKIFLTETNMIKKNLITKNK